MEIRRVKIGKLKPAVYNPRRDLRPGDAEYEKLKKSILEFGHVTPLVWNERTGNVVGGHQALKILKAAGRKEVDVSVVDLSESKEKALNLALNRIQGGWDYPMLKDLFLEIDTGEFDMAITGFDVDEMAEIIRPFEPRDGEKELDENLGTKNVCPKCGYAGIMGKITLKNKE